MNDDARFMALALALGRRGQGNVWPNPAVGCVIVADGRIVGRGWTAPGGRPHAETRALAQAGAAARGATAYVSLEPCAHHGQTPPCAVALADAGVARVVVPVADPDPRVAGRGLEMLRGAGITVETGCLEDAARADLSGFLMRVAEGRPRVTLKLATSFDGRIATASGDSQWITGARARRQVHALRACHDAVMVGGGTARADDPSLTVRGLGIAAQPVRVVISRRLDLPRDSKLARSAAAPAVWLCHGPDVAADRVDAWQALGARTVPCALSGGQVDPASVLAELGALGLTSVFCEGGGTLAAALLGAGLVDELVGFTAGLALGAEGRPAIGALGLTALDEAGRFRLAETRAVGGDVMHRWLRA
ncbi:bifunctional diaminohydroxyphosphoribosylaminopyrimidine deaminase/5-amino-6-(5-phosphoribosylamino)uracil reductase RibD [Roseovarius salinarum]|uniref:bifunctional diaminohydroxyphosphoribosylaminopyrimidine deaminase/5-amino-6-(5-phosphoribosylamino)uracil reductase RibD n=1 Tax=Roseovarius salinarum TaxID=1981892 RepID=UPI000C32B18A|nr:bifunctional diaminohydroxyphosphoribosylaminopyrimidine deaminase/5-amino-6-(5-phosphoribosylamino)uracil reductase RibD [Roseovarius salinarum]